MNWIIGILLFIGFHFILYWIIPKGNALHEVFRIPQYNWDLRRAKIENIEVETYTFGKHSKQYLLYIEPTNRPIDKDKVIIYYHGGGWMFGSPREFILNACFYTSMGYTVIMPSYRCLPFHRFKTIRQDLNLAMDKCVDIMEEKNITHKDIILGGMSAGANLVALIMYDQMELKKTRLSQKKMVGLMLFGGPLNLHEMARTPLLYLYAGGRKSAIFHKASPIQFIQREPLTQPIDCPVLIIQGNKDGMVHYRNATTFYQQLKEIQQNPITFHTLDSGTHLDAGKWVFGQQPTKQWIENWLSMQSNM